MAANKEPIFVLTPQVSWTPWMTAANTARDGTGTTEVVFTGAANGSYLKDLGFKASGTNVATVARVFINNGGDPQVAANNALIAEQSLGPQTASENSGLPNFSLGLNMAIPPGYRVMVALGTAVASGWQAVATGGSY